MANGHATALPMLSHLLRRGVGADIEGATGEKLTRLI
ncbi:hypothetical protein J433_09322 [Corynebacterium glutamicum MT]|uniref:Uncharacterized protein n=1 Tax=Corynebacterium glutamicum (strain R) TaxID=340322 RepID=A0AB72VBX1_CORGB|nr:hypothetical protein J433_09322 [Corynebacterium glutamicum MT]BAF54719.1 hypothetical protein cgR_1725 [Corynebacterium glutamicum R]